MLKVDQERRFTVVIVVVAVIAIAMTASTINSVTEVTGGDGGVNVDPPDRAISDGSDQGDRQQPGVDDGGEVGSENRVRLTRCVEFLTTPTAVLGLVVGALLVVYVIYRRVNLATAVFSSFVVVPSTFGTWAILTNCVSGQGGTGPTMSGGSIVAGQGSSVVSAPAVSPTALGIAFAFLVALSVAVLLTVTGDEESFDVVEDEDLDEPDEAAFARAAGRAADRIEEANVAVDNAVYRAWSQMTNLLDIPDPETSAPMDFADAAIEFGMDEDDVHELTELFNEVRYGHESPEEREDRAIEILRHIEATYEESGDGSEAGGNRK